MGPNHELLMPFWMDPVKKIRLKAAPKIFFNKKTTLNKEMTETKQKKWHIPQNWLVIINGDQPTTFN